MSSPNDSLIALRKRLEIYDQAELDVSAQDGRASSVSLFSAAQRKRFVAIKRLHNAMLPESTDASFALHTSFGALPPEFDLTALRDELEAMWWKTRHQEKRRQDRIALAVERKHRGTEALNIEQELRRPLSNMSITQLENLANETAVKAHTEWKPQEQASDRLTLRMDTVMEPPRNADEMASDILEQKSLCKGCLNPLKQKLFGSFGPHDAHFCHLTGYYYCPSCHSGDRSKHPIPARCLQLWDFAAKPVCDKASDFLEMNFDKPFVCVSAVRPSLFVELPHLETCRKMRLQLMMLHAIGVQCSKFRATFYTLSKKKKPDGLDWDAPDDDSPRAIQNSSSNSVGGSFSQTYIPEDVRYRIEDSEHWSLADLSTFNQQFPKLPAPCLSVIDSEQCPIYIFLRRVRTQMVRHIATGCKECRARANKRCALCHAEDVIFAFDIETVYNCPLCSAVYHRRCWGSLASEGNRCVDCEARHTQRGYQ